MDQVEKEDLLPLNDYPGIDQPKQDHDNSELPDNGNSGEFYVGQEGYKKQLLFQRSTVLTLTHTRCSLKKHIYKRLTYKLRRYLI